MSDRLEVTMKLNPLIKPLSIINGLLLAFLLMADLHMTRNRNAVGLTNSLAESLKDTKVQPFDIETIDGNRIEFGSANDRFPNMLVFSSAGCSACDSMYVDLQAVSMPILVVISGDKQMIKEKVAQYGIREAIGWDRDFGVTQMYSIDTFPTAILVNSEGVIAEVERGSSCIENILDSLN